MIPELCAQNGKKWTKNLRIQWTASSYTWKIKEPDNAMKPEGFKVENPTQTATDKEATVIKPQAREPLGSKEHGQ